MKQIRHEGQAPSVAKKREKTMKKYLFYVGSALLALSLSACGGKTQEGNEGDENALGAAATGGPEYDPCSETTQKVGDYTVSVKCQADSANVVKDSYDTEFYDNKVTVSITNADGNVFTHTFTKSEFEGNYKASAAILQGMAYRQRSNGLFEFGAQVGEPGNPEDGMPFCVKVATDGSYTIEVDYNQD